MIKKLRIKLVAASMISLVIVLAVIVGAASLLNYRTVVLEADKTLVLLSENGGDFPDMKLPPDGFLSKKPELPYESRFFSVSFDRSGNVIGKDMGRIAAVSPEKAETYAKSVFESGKGKGFADNFRFTVSERGAEIQVIFLDCGRSLDSFFNFVLSCAAMSVLGLLGVLVILIFASGRIVKPFSESYEKQKRFITDAGHEIKTPLTVINADAEVLKMDIGENEWLDSICEETKRLADLTDSLIFLARTEEMQSASKAEEFSFSNTVEKEVESFRAFAIISQKDFFVKIEPNITLRGDEKAVQRLADILLDNALKYSGEGGSISVTLEKHKNQTHLSVSNTTSDPVSKEDIKHIFDRFYRTDRSRNTKTGGYGLGLSIAAAIVSAHGGKITAFGDGSSYLTVSAVFPL